MKNNISSRVAYGGILTALAMIFSYAETLIPLNFGVPGIKLGLANLVVLLGLTFLKPVDVFLVSMVRIFLSSLLFGNAMSLAYSLAGGILSFLVMLLISRVEGFSLIGISIAGGVTHNIGQIVTAAIIVKTMKLTWYLPVLIVAGLITGAIVGAIAVSVMPAVKKVMKTQK